MSRRRSWTEDDLKAAVQASSSIRQVLTYLKLIPAGGNYVQVMSEIKRLNISHRHLVGKAWRKGHKFVSTPRRSLESILIKGSNFQSFKLKKRLFSSGIKTQRCELCSWAEISEDGRIPLELDHINGDRYDNRLENLRVLCPNCHSLQPTHRGRNKKGRGGEIGRRATLKMS